MKTSGRKSRNVVDTRTKSGKAAHNTQVDYLETNRSTNSRLLQNSSLSGARRVRTIEDAIYENVNNPGKSVYAQRMNRTRQESHKPQRLKKK